MISWGHQGGGNAGLNQAQQEPKLSPGGHGRGCQLPGEGPAENKPGLGIFEPGQLQAIQSRAQGHLRVHGQLSREVRGQ